MVRRLSWASLSSPTRLFQVFCFSMLAWSALYASLAKARAASTYRQTAYRIDNAIDLMFSIALCDGDGGERGGGCMHPWPRHELRPPTTDRIEDRHCCRVDVLHCFVWWGCCGGKGGGGGGMRPRPRRELQLPTADSTEARHCQRVDMCNICHCFVWGQRKGRGEGCMWFSNHNGSPSMEPF